MVDGNGKATTFLILKEKGLVSLWAVSLLSKGATG